MNGVGGVDRAQGPDRSHDADVQNPPNVYHPFGDPGSTPAYEAYRDPATAHGWQNAYDDTVQLDEVVGEGPDPAGSGPGGDGFGRDISGGDVSGGDISGGGGSAAGHVAYRVGGPEALDAAGHRARPAGGRRVTLGRRRARRRGALIAGGIGAAVFVGAAVAGVAGLGSSRQEGPGAPASVESAPADARSGEAEAASPPADGASGAAASASPGSSSPDTSTNPSPDGTTPEPSDSTSPSVTPPVSPSPTAASSPRGNSNGNQGRGQGATKAPK